MSLADNIARIRQRMERAAIRAERSGEDIALMAVTKTQPGSAIRQAYDAGVRLFGENRVQEFEGKAAELGKLRDAYFHLIGHLQSNKVAKAAELFDAVDSLDSLKVAQKLNVAAQRSGERLQVLIEVNVGGERAKSGLAPRSHELEELLGVAASLGSLEIRGLMTIPPFTEDPEGARPYFRMLRELRDQIAARKMPGIKMDELSMGMSHDFELAIEEGSTCVRVGTAIFGQRSKSTAEVQRR